MSEIHFNPNNKDALVLDNKEAKFFVGIVTPSSNTEKLFVNNCEVEFIDGALNLREVSASLIELKDENGAVVMEMKCAGKEVMLNLERDNSFSIFSNGVDSLMVTSDGELHLHSPKVIGGIDCDSGEFDSLEAEDATLTNLITSNIRSMVVDVEEEVTVGDASMFDKKGDLTLKDKNTGAMTLGSLADKIPCSLGSQRALVAFQAQNTPVIIPHPGKPGMVLVTDDSELGFGWVEK